MSLDIKPGWLARQFSDLETPYSEAEFEALQWSDREGAGPHPSIYKLRATVDRLSASLKAAQEAIETLLASAYPHPTEHPTMTAAWKVGREALAAIDADTTGLPLPLAEPPQPT